MMAAGRSTQRDISWLLVTMLTVMLLGLIWLTVTHGRYGLVLAVLCGALLGKAAIGKPYGAGANG